MFKFIKDISKKLSTGIKESTDKISDNLNKIVFHRKLSNEILDEIEEALLKSDIGYNMTAKLIEDLRQKKFDKEIKIQEVKKIFADFLSQKLSHLESDFDIKKICDRKNNPKVLMMVGANGSGKTSMCGKIANMAKKSGKNAFLIPADTFRAAAGSQLNVLAGKIGVDILKSDLTDSSAMIYSGIQNGISDNRDIVIVDTAGRIHIRDDLMEELFKNFKTVKKVLGREADMVFLVIDATIGQNMKSQVEKFSNKIKIDGIIITKLDGSAKAGAIISAIDETNIPIKIIGMGEGIDDIMPFRVDDFCKNLFGL